jgi:methylenetetrahydrofolate dehydrogenase (NADP+)/methenyltetrahydrofolate cyclohydrolase
MKNKPLILSGKDVSLDVYKNLKLRIQSLSKKGVFPGLAVVLVGENPASRVYVNSKTKTFKKLSIHSKTYTLPVDVTSKDLLDLIKSLNKNHLYHGILVQLPLPGHINAQDVINSISPEKDVDGFHPQNAGLLSIGKPRFIPCTPKGIMRILNFYNLDLNGKHIVVIGRSNIVGRPVSILCSQKISGANGTVTICHSGSKNISNFTLTADIIIVALGVPNYLKSHMVKDDSVIIDVGINRISSKESNKGYKLTGDADFTNLSNNVSAITPVPGGVGPMTIAMLVENTIEAAETTLN